MAATGSTFDRITFDPKILGGRACIRGMRIPASVIVGQLAQGLSVEQIFADYPDLQAKTSARLFNTPRG
jgi:uncharacterized protein (DUF433 family)